MNMNNTNTKGTTLERCDEIHTKMNGDNMNNI